MRARWLMGLLLFSAILATGCSQLKQLAADRTYLTPVPQATLDAYQAGQPVTNRLQAVTAAQAGGMLNFHMEWDAPPRVIYAESMDYQAARQRVKTDDASAYVMLEAAGGRSTQTGSRPCENLNLR